MPFLWVTLFADSVTLAFTVFAATKRPLLIDFLTVGLAMCMLAAALHQVIFKHCHLYILALTDVINLILTYRMAKLWGDGRLGKH